MRKLTLLTAAVLATFAVSGLSACKGGSLTKDECAKMIDHMTDVAMKGQGVAPSPELKKAAQAQMGGVVDECVKEGSRGDYDCAMSADTVEAMEKCAK